MKLNVIEVSNAEAQKRLTLSGKDFATDPSEGNTSAGLTAKKAQRLPEQRKIRKGQDQVTVF